MAIDPLTAVLEIGGKVLDKIFPDPVERAKAEVALKTLEQNGELAAIAGQIEINKVEAASDSFFVKGWRPFIGWTCGAACAWNWVGISICNTLINIFGSPIVLKTADISDMLPILVGMLGLGGLRTYEKINLKGK